MPQAGDERLAEERQTKDEKLAAFRDENGEPRKLPKAERQKLIHQQFPSIDTLNWQNAFRNDTDLFTRMMRDIIKLDQREPGKSGPRPNNMDYRKAMESFRQIFGEDFSVEPFAEAFQFLSRDYSLTQIARKVKISRTRVHRLLRGEELPTKEDMRLIAEGLGKQPSYFVEYRRSFIIEQLSKALLAAPESTITYYQKLLKVQ